MSDLAAFLADRLAEDEAAARQSGLSPQRWQPDHYELLDPSNRDQAHIARHDPARVLREVAAKRRMLSDLDLSYPDEEHMLRLLAAVWSDHPDYDESWRP